MSGVFKTWMMRAETGKDGTTKVIASTNMGNCINKSSVNQRVYGV